MFANVVRARVFQCETGDVGKEVAIKIIRSQESMFVSFATTSSLTCSQRVRYKAGQKEVQILNRLRQSDPEDKKHVVRLERTFEHRGHLCLVFESLRSSLVPVSSYFTLIFFFCT